MCERHTKLLWACADIIGSIYFEWTDEQQKVFENLKAKLEEALSLLLPYFDKQFILYTDVNFDGLGAALHQKHMLDGKEV